MDIKYSFDYIFYDLYLLIDEISIRYRHEVGIGIDGLEIIGDQWQLKILDFNGYNLQRFTDEVKKHILLTIEYIVNNRTYLEGFLPFFIEKLEVKRVKYERIQNFTEKYEDLKSSNHLKLNYLGYENDYGMHSDAIRSNHDENSFEEIQRQSIVFINIILKELTRLILSLKHELNIISSQKEGLNDDERKSYFISLLTEWKIEELFNELNSHQSFKFDNQIINFSARYRILNKDKNEGIINRNDFDIGLAKIINGLISIISQKELSRTMPS